MFRKDPDGYFRAQPLENFEWLRHGFGTREAQYPHGVTTVRQVHSARVLNASEIGSYDEGDALIGNTPGTCVGVKTADCFPILLVDPVHRAVAAIHAGWRGTKQQIVSETIRSMREVFRTSAKELHAAIGPGIGKCCFEVGSEVAIQFGIADIGKVKLDLAGVLIEQLIGENVPERHIHSARLCTVCGRGDFFSFRREREHAGRMVSYIARIN